MSVPLAQSDRRLARFDLRRRRFAVAGGSLSLVMPVSMTDVLQRQAVGRHTEQPYWAEVWPAGLTLARSIMRGPRLDGRAVLDLGCGLGLPGIAAGCRGAAVTFVDRETDAVAFAEFNARCNGVVGARALVADWGHDSLAGPYDLVLLADVTYRLPDHGPLLRALQAVVHAGGEVWVVDPFREVGDVFAHRAAKVFAADEMRLPGHDGSGRIAVRLLRLRPRPAP